MKTRTIKELLILLRKFLSANIVSTPDCGSICWCNDEMYLKGIINDAQWGVLSEYISDHIPEDIGDYESPGGCPGFWWPYGELAPRLEFLDKLISEL